MKRSVHGECKSPACLVGLETSRQVMDYKHVWKRMDERVAESIAREVEKEKDMKMVMVVAPDAEHPSVIEAFAKLFKMLVSQGNLAHITLKVHSECEPVFVAQLHDLVFDPIAAIEELHVTRCDRDAGLSSNVLVHSILRPLTCFVRIYTLRFSHMRLKAERFEETGQMLENLLYFNENLIELAMDHACLDDEMVRYIATGLEKRKRCLMRLSLANNSISATGARFLLAALLSKSDFGLFACVRVLVLDDNNIGWCTEIEQVIRASCTQQLSLCNNPLLPKHKKILMDLRNIVL